MTDQLNPDDRYSTDMKCPDCGARVLIGCTECGVRIRGSFHVAMHLGGHDHDTSARPTFCDRCGAAHPWATREQRIFELENLLDEEEIDEADRVFVLDRLRELRESAYQDDKKTTQILRQITSRAGSFLTSGPASRILETVVTAKIRHDLGI